MAKIIEGKIVDIEKVDAFSIPTVTQGVKKSEQWKYANCKGGHGTYVTGFVSSCPPSLNVKIYVAELKQHFHCECYVQTLNAAGKKKMSEKLKKFILSHKLKKVSLKLHMAEKVTKYNKNKYVMKVEGSLVDEDKNVIVFDPSVLVDGYK